MKNAIYRENFSENDIRPDELTAKTAIAYKEDLKWLLENKNEFVQVNCPACDRKTDYLAFQKNMLDYVKCEYCSTVYINPRPSLDLIKRFYKQSKGYEIWNKCTFPASEAVRREKIFKPRVNSILELCNKYNVNNNILVEVGAGFGTFSEEMAARGHFKEIIAIEPTPSLADSCKHKGLTVIDKAVEDVELTEKADVVATFEVIEHLFSPREFIKGCERLLNSGGIIVITCPNINGFDNMVLGVKSSSIDYGHLNYFTPQSLSLLVTSFGFEVVEILTPGKLDAELVRKQALAGNYSLDNQPFLKYILIDKWDELGAGFQEYLAHNMLSGHMWVVARKK